MGVTFAGFLRFELQQRGVRGFALGCFFALATAASELDAGVKDGAFEDAIVVGAGGGNDRITRRFRGRGLQEFLQLALWVFKNGDYGELAEGAQEFPQNEFFGGLKSAIQEQCAEQSFERICQRRRPITSTGEFLATAQEEVAAEFEMTGALSQAAAVHEFCPSFGQRTFAESLKPLIKLPSKDQLQHRVAEEFEALICLHRQPLFVGD